MKRPLILNVVSLLAILLFVVFGLSSCKKDIETKLNPNDKFSNLERTTASFMGQIILEDGSPAKGVTVKIETHQFITDEDGFFYFSDINVPKNAAVVKVEHIGYFNAYRTLKIIPHKDNTVKIMLLKMPTPKSIQSNVGGTVNVVNGGSVDFQSNSFIDVITGETYNGTVQIYAKWIDPTSPDLPFMIPGSLRAVNEDGYETGLITYGMQWVELRGSAGQELQLDTGKNATLHFPIPATLLGNAPNEIPLWNLSDDNGMWIEEGSATKLGTEYVGEVAHFSPWNVDMPFLNPGPRPELVDVRCKIVDKNGKPLSGILVRLETESGGGLVSWAYANQDGEVTLIAAANTDYTLAYSPQGCDRTATKFDIRKINVSGDLVNLGTLTAPEPNPPTIITGTLEDCFSDVLANAPVKFVSNAEVTTVLSDENGNFHFRLQCVSDGSSCRIIGYDIADNNYGTEYFRVNEGVENAIGTLTACGYSNTYVRWTVTHTPNSIPIKYSVTDAGGTFFQSYYQGATSINAYEPPTHAVFKFTGSQDLTGTHQLISYYDHIEPSLSITPAAVTLFHYGQIGDLIDGRFETQATGGSYNNATIKCNFRVLRQQ